MVALAGIGIHSGKRSRVWLHRSGQASWLHFRQGRSYIPAQWRYVVATPRATVLGHGGARITTVEHLLAACAFLGWWRGLVIEVEGNELPIFDGSAQDWLEPLQQLGTPPPTPSPYQLRRSLHYRTRRSHIRASPAATPQLHSCIDFPQPCIGQQHWSGSLDDYRQIANARTFGFAEELAMLHARGYARGASQDNVLVFGQQAPITPLRYPDEPVRHKALDAWGDLLLLGHPLQAKLSIVRGSHRAHVGFMRKLMRQGLLYLDQP